MSIGDGESDIRRDNVHPPGDADEDRDHGTPAEPPQGLGHEVGDNHSPGLGVQFLQEGNIHQVEEVQQIRPKRFRR